MPSATARSPRLLVQAGDQIDAKDLLVVFG